MALALDVHDLSLRYPGSVKPAVDGMRFAVERGEIFGLLGPNGAGKTSTLAMLSCLTAPSSGTAHICGFDLRRQTNEVKRRIGLVPQDLALYPNLSARTNLRFFGALYGLSGKHLQQRVAATLTTVGLIDRADEPIDRFSGGMKRRINIAAGLLHEPEILFLDEPTVGVDPQSRNFIFEHINALRDAGLTVIYTTHYMDEVERMADRVAIIDHGRLIALDRPQALISAMGGVIELELTRPLATPLRVELAGLDGVAELRGETPLHIHCDHPAQRIPAALALVAARGAEILGVTVHQPSLETVFLELTGRRLRE